MLSYDLNITQSGNEVLRCIKVNLRIPAYTLHYFFEDFLEITVLLGLLIIEKNTIRVTWFWFVVLKCLSVDLLRDDV